MGTVTVTENFSLTTERNFEHSKKEVYDAWINRESLVSWFAPSADFTTVIHQLDLKVGGLYKLEMIAPDGSSHVIDGEYVTLKPYDQIAFTWHWQNDEQSVNSLVTINLQQQETSTNMILIHEKLKSKDSVTYHTEGWMGCLQQLEVFIN